MLDKNAALQKICTAFGGDIEYSQGGGTNASAKDGDLMIIKASGYTLADMMVKDGYVQLLYQPIADIYTRENSISEDEARRITQSAVQAGSQLKPSIETGFHSFLNTFVVHLHPIYLIAILCLEKSEEIIRTLYPDINLVTAGYQRPGHNLSREVAKKLKEMSFRPKSTDEVEKSPAAKMRITKDPSTSRSLSREKSRDSAPTTSAGRRDDKKNITIFLKNHGLIVSGDDSDTCVSIAKEICARAKQYVLQETDTKAVSYADLKQDADGFLGCEYGGESEYLYPDAVVFLYDIKEGRKPYTIVNGRVRYALSHDKARQIDEVLFAHNVIAGFAKQLGPYHSLSNTEVQALIDMEEEKYRKQLL